MSDLQNQTPADTYKGLLQVGDYTNGVDANSEYIQDGEGTNSVLSISTTKVGVGTISPSAELDVSGNVVADEYALDQTSTSSSAVAIHAPTTNELAIRTNSTEAMRIDSDGNVGIGATSPSSKLEITDSINHLNLKVPDRVSQGVVKFSDIDGLGGAINYDHNTDKLHFITDGTATPANGALNIDSDGNVGIGIESFGTNASKVIGIGNATAPTSSPANIVQLYAEDVTASSELRVRDEAGNVTTLSPHAKDAPDSLYDSGKGVDEMHRVANHYLGTIVFTNVDRRNDLMQKQLNGEELPEDRTFKVTETFAEYNARTGANLQVEDWDANQQAIANADESYVKKPKPDWLT